MSPQERTMRARIAAYSLHAKVDGREITSNARRAFLDRFEKSVDPNGTLPVAERCRRATAARKAYFTALALQSAKSRKQHREVQR